MEENTEALAITAGMKLTTNGWLASDFVEVSAVGKEMFLAKNLGKEKELAWPIDLGWKLYVPPPVKLAPAFYRICGDWHVSLALFSSEKLAQAHLPSLKSVRWPALPGPDGYYTVPD